MKTFAAIDVGSYEMMLKIFEVSEKKGLREIDSLRHSLDLGTGSYATGSISSEKVDELCRILTRFSDVMKSYKIDDYKAYGTSAIRETRDSAVVLDQVERRTGIKIDILSNSEQRFLDYKSVAAKQDDFLKIIEKPAAIVDVGGGSIQISLFDNDKLVSTQNMRLGVLRIRESLSRMDVKSGRVAEAIKEYAAFQLEAFRKMYVRDIKVETAIIVDDYISALVDRNASPDGGRRYVSVEDLDGFIYRVSSESVYEASKKLKITEEGLVMTFISSVIVRQICEIMKAERLWVPGVSLCDGIAYEYAEKTKVLKIRHDFTEDILACARTVSRRYMGSEAMEDAIDRTSVAIFNTMKKIHKLGSRERTLLRIAAILNDCGYYISMQNRSECAYDIIMSTEMIGLSHSERVIIANTVKYNHAQLKPNEMDYYPEFMNMQDYLLMMKLTAILRVAETVCRTPEKALDVSFRLKDEELLITYGDEQSTSIEKGLMKDRSSLMKEVFGVTAVVRKTL
ncbi:MAG: exopolyphosphatase [Lachnospiraceae bacterium]|nr:exopolyphosphatase [Lachnospiraceae bacterium]